MATSKVRTSTQVNIDADLDAQSHKVVNVTDPAAAQDAATKHYVDTHSLSQSNFIINEAPAGTIDGSNVTFTLANTPVAGTEQVRLNGLGQISGAGNDYTISGAVITYLAAPKTGDIIRVDYMK